MLGTIYRKLNKNKDSRFLDAEVYRKKSKESHEKNTIFQLSEQAALKVDFCSVTDSASLADIQYFRVKPTTLSAQNPDDQDFITVDASLEKQVPPDFSYKPVPTRSNVFEINDIEYAAEPFVEDVDYASVKVLSAKPVLSVVPSGCLAIPTLGVFSDSRAYSAFVSCELAKLEVDIRHFNHPRTLNATRYSHLDTIDAWIVFLSDESENDFLDDFLDRYIDKPTLFLVPKSGRKTTTKTIQAFVEELSN